ncbi:hypothetical protein JMJ35_002947 [Cladonia borealis]|uniref:DUF6594 domain-containing protein n=1 Tax=Cladonia borealis TaxID=184061 RepID=A0AA39R3V2_9LECA|nr:hypothetical protein JMJ35_002947 [Cladonia borealis]
MPISSELQDPPAPWEPSQVEVGSKPWKYAGYRLFCEFVSSDEDFFVLRRFGALSARVLLNLQDQLARLEEELEAIEQKLRQRDKNVHNGSFRGETDEKRKNIITEAQHVLREYNDLVLQHSQLRARPKVPRKDINSLETWFDYNHKTAIHPPETKYIKHPSDLFTLVPASKSPLRLFLERSRRFRLLKLWRQKPSDSTMARDEDVHYISDAKIDHLVTVFIMSIGLIMLIAPLWILTYLGGLARRLAISSTFIVLFVVLISWTTVAKPFESLAAAAAYAAVLMVFIRFSGSE